LPKPQRIVKREHCVGCSLFARPQPTPLQASPSREARDECSRISTIRRHQPDSAVGHVIATGLLGRAEAADLLLDVATSHGLVHEHGDDFIQQIMAEGLNCEARQ
jgi:hypothetical protein